LANTIGWTVALLVFIAIFWFVGIEAGLLPLVLERIAARRAEQTRKPVSTIWFVDLDQHRALETENFDKATRANPTIR
jgi:hypothetical protein